MTDETLTALDVLTRMPGFGEAFSSVKQLLSDAREEPVRAWLAYNERRELAHAWGEEVAAATEFVRGALDAGDFRAVIDGADDALPQARAVGLGVSVGELEDLRAQALVRLSEPGDRGQRIDEAILGFGRAIEVSLNPVQRASALMHLGLAYAERLRGDHADNFDRAIAALRDALALLSPYDCPEMTAFVQHNLAWAVINREGGDRLSDLQEAEELCRDALVTRRLVENPVDWAHTQINRGTALEGLVQLGAADRNDAVAVYAEVIAADDRVPPWLVGVAEFSWGRFLHGVARPSPEQVAADSERSSPDPQPDEDVLLNASRAHLREAVRLSASDQDTLRRGRALTELASVCMDLDALDEGISSARQALTYVGPRSDPIRAAKAAGILGEMLCSRADWGSAVEAYEIALEAAEFSFHNQLGDESREREIRRTGNLHRWASFALARAGRALEAVLTLEAGRGREIRRRVESVGLAHDLNALPEDVTSAYRSAARDVARARVGPEAAAAARRFQEVVAEIRQLPGMSAFGVAARVADLGAATEAGWPLLYINPTPWGTVLLRVTLDSREGVGVESSFLPPTSIGIWLRLTLGIESFDGWDPNSEKASYVIGIGATTDADIAAEINAVLPWLGTEIAAPCSALLAGCGARGVTLVACGALASAPLHAATWSTDGATRCLLDFVPVRYAPSAVAASAATRRLERQGTREPFLVALADPEGNLPAAGPEVDEVARFFPNRWRKAYAADATLGFLDANASRATHLHLACHASGALFGESEAAVWLADGGVSVRQLGGLALDTRVTVVSACQGAQVTMSVLPNEVISISAVLLLAGSACAIASLWPVDDEATALLMMRLYREMLEHEIRPPEALRKAQLWLRGLRTDEADDVLRKHPAVRQASAHNSARRGSDRPTEGERHHPWGDQPFAHPFFWAGFIASGI